MRLDKYLKVSRLIKRRTVANEACDGGRVTVNGKVARASYDVKVGDVIALHFGERAHAVLWPADHDAGFLGDDVRDADAEVVEALFGVVERGAQQVAGVFVAPEFQ